MMLEIIYILLESRMHLIDARTVREQGVQVILAPEFQI